MQKILVVDDVELNRELLRYILEEEYTIETAADGKEAIQKLQESREETGAVLLDLQMPDMDGFAVISELKERGWMQSFPVLVISGEYTIDVENRCLELGVSDFIHKPFGTSVVRNRIRNAMELFSTRKKLERKVEEQAEALREQNEIIRRHTEKLRQKKSFNRLMMVA